VGFVDVLVLFVADAQEELPLEYVAQPSFGCSPCGKVDAHAAAFCFVGQLAHESAQSDAAFVAFVEKLGQQFLFASDL
jgi:hypothetical protein